ncbi:MAG: NAD(+)/NADH kinase [Thermoclostridium sp.]|nr:NAD(+)/NADH kinase [Thermoclostridium sp.]
MEQIRIGLSVNEKRDKDLLVTKKVIECIWKYDMIPLLLKPVAASLGLPGGVDETEFYETSALMVSLGGDGTLLNAARSVFRYDIPVFGINLGTVGFLAEVEINQIENAFLHLSRGEYTLVNRMVLSACIIRNGNCVFEGIALNDVVVSRGGLSRLIRLKVYVDNQFIDSFPGDGVIVSTPTGSTAYTLSAGGPIVQPDMQMMITTPICPHILYSRSFITSPERILRICVNDDYPDSAIITLDGQEGFGVVAGDAITIQCMDKGVRFVSIYQLNFYDVLRAKIHGRENE